MAYPNRRREIERQHGEQMQTLLPRKVRELGTLQAVAKDFGVTYNALYKWMRELGLEKHVYITPRGEDVCK